MSEATAPAVGGPVRLRAPAHQVSPRSRWFWGVRALLAWLVPLVIEIVIAVRTHGDRGPAELVIAGTALLAIAHISVMPQWRYRVHRWEATPTAVYTQSGWINQQRRIAPLSRIQTVDTERGPIEQLFGLANVTVTTASAAGPLKIHGLALTTAQQLVDELTSATGQSAGDAT